MSAGPFKIARYGVGDRDTLVAYPCGANLTLYSGEVALLSGSGSTTVGYLKDPASPGASDLVVGMIGNPAGGTAFAGATTTTTGVATGTTDGGVWMDVDNGTFLFQSGSGADALTEALVGTTVFYQGENSSGPIAAATNGSSTRPKLGTLLPQDPGIHGGFTPGANYWPVKLNVVGGP